MTQFSSGGIFLDICFFLLSYVLLYPIWKGKKVSLNKVAFCTFLSLLFFIFPFYGGDYYHYYEYYEEIIKYPDRDGSVEPVYNFIAQNTFNLYHLFRLIVWGTALFIILKICQLSHSDKGCFLLILNCGYITLLAYARVTLAMAVLFYGLIVLIRDSNNFCNIIFGISLMAVSYFFHKSALFGIAMVLASIIFAKFGKSAFIILIGAMPLVIGILTYIVGDFLNSGVDDYINTRAAQGYLTRQESETGVGATILNLLQRSPYYILSSIFIYETFTKDSNIPIIQRVFGSSLFLITLTSSLFLLDFGLNTSTIYYRFLNFAAIPSIVYLTYIKKMNLVPQLSTLTFNILSLSVLYSLGYTFYLSII